MLPLLRKDLHDSTYQQPKHIRKLKIYLQVIHAKMVQYLLEVYYKATLIHHPIRLEEHREEVCSRHMHLF